MKTYIFKTNLFRDKKISRDIEVKELAEFGVTESKTKYPRIIKKVGKSPEQYPEVEE